MFAAISITKKYFEFPSSIPCLLKQDVVFTVIIWHLIL